MQDGGKELNEIISVKGSMNSVNKEKFRSLARALKLQAKEYQRRLKDLNGEAGRLREMQERYVPREVHDRTVEAMKLSFEVSIKELEGKIELLNDYKTKQEGKGTWVQYVPWLIAALSLAFGIFKK